ncbi:MAG TPA: flavin reductase family protein [Armatimonadota bacterium]|jgi:flavin reductase (DIM6/NTAB) family NADH-FMN oxidoreductase RutF
MQPLTETDYEHISLCDLEPEVARVVMGACISPRPIALITTLGPGGIVNAAPFSNFMGVATEPPLIAFGIGPRNGEEKDTLRNAREHGHFVINCVSVEMAEAMHHTAADYPRDRSEVDAAGLTTLPGTDQPVPRIAEAPIHMECRVYKIVDLGEPKPDHAIVVGEVLRLHVRRDCMGQGSIPDAVAWNPLGGLGDDYMKPGETFSLEYPSPKPVEQR